MSSVWLCDQKEITWTFSADLGKASFKVISFCKKIVNKKNQQPSDVFGTCWSFIGPRNLKWSGVGKKVPFEQFSSTTDQRKNSKSWELLTVENQVVHYVVWQELEEILGHCSSVSLVNGDLCWPDGDESDRRDFLEGHSAGKKMILFDEGCKTTCTLSCLFPVFP